MSASPPYPPTPLYRKAVLVLFTLLVGLIRVDGANALEGSATASDPLKVDLLGVFAHPDDETGAAGTLVHYALGRGMKVAAVYCTRGEGGGNMVGTQYGSALGILREGELRECLHLMGIRHCFFLERADFAYTESLAITLEKWGHQETLERLVRLIRILRPEVVLTMNPAPNPGQHGNHQAAGLLAIEAFDAAARLDRFPEQITLEGLHPWQVRKLYHGGPAGAGATIDVMKALPDGRIPAAIAGEALVHHRSQGFGGMATSPWLLRPQSWVLVKSVVPFVDHEEDLFRGLPATEPIIQQNPSISPHDQVPVHPLRFVPRPSVEFYENWIHQQGIGHVAASFEPDIPVVAGEPTRVVLVCPDSSITAVQDPSSWNLPDGWRLEGRPNPVPSGPGRSRRVVALIRAPAGHPSDGEVRVTPSTLPQKLSATARLHPVPRTAAPRIHGRLALDAPLDDPEWARLPAQEIPSTFTWQGEASGPSDCGGTFRVGHSKTHLWIEVRVRDDVVVSNIAPDDIKAHWRSDSVEICLDPSPGSAHTLGCTKMGIFPFDTTGRVRACRDADARPGVFERVAPGTGLRSWKTQDGYVVRASIPFSEIAPGRGGIGSRLGFNVLIYDGDKADAAVGENINRVRLAWAPRPGVQGRPEDWGRLDLE